MCDQGHKVTFDSQKCEIRKEGLGKLVATGCKNFKQHICVKRNWK
jgi:hypothetical protein